MTVHPVDPATQRLAARIGALEDIVAALLRRSGVPEHLILAWRRAEKEGTDYGLRGAANAIACHLSDKPSARRGS